MDRLRRNAELLRGALREAGAEYGGSRTQIIPLVVGDPVATVRASERALARGVFAQAIRPPTVPPGSSRLRLSVMASHTPSELQAAARTLAGAVAGARASAPRAAVFDGLADAA